MWIIPALLSAFFTALIALVSKIGLAKVDSSLGFAIQSIVTMIFAVGYVAITGKARDLTSIEGRAWPFLLGAGALSAIAYLFYFSAIKLGDVSRVAPIDRLSLVFSVVLAAMFLSEKVNGPTIFGVSLMAIGALIVAAWGSAK
ncbi:transporter family protein [Abditibacterium utsteinense]|uniref:Transporter family protein n=2 Tax=Abditibacterium utsteinense TaxID=1960156 RepID=A0A2S8SRF0_9BACT|nr:transporter family protein [Abditibacterium utsteinense]